jgi:hypothetical protein
LLGFIYHAVSVASCCSLRCADVSGEQHACRRRHARCWRW